MSTVRTQVIQTHMWELLELNVTHILYVIGEKLGLKGELGY